MLFLHFLVCSSAFSKTNIIARSIKKKNPGISPGDFQRDMYSHIWITAEWPGGVFAKRRDGGHTRVGVDRRWDGGEGGGDKGQ